MLHAFIYFIFFFFDYLAFFFQQRNWEVYSCVYFLIWVKSFPIYLYIFFFIFPGSLISRLVWRKCRQEGRSFLVGGKRSRQFSRCRSSVLPVFPLRSECVRRALRLHQGMNENSIQLSATRREETGAFPP